MKMSPKNQFLDLEEVIGLKAELEWVLESMGEGKREMFFQ